MTSLKNDLVWNDDGGDNFIDENDIEIVSLLDDHDDKSRSEDYGHDQTDALRTDQNDYKQETSPRSQLFGVCATIGLVLFLATILLSRSSTVPDIHTPTDISKHNNVDANNDENTQSISLPPSSPPPSAAAIAEEIEESDTENIDDDEIEWFELTTGNSRIDQAYRLAMDELHQNIEYDSNDSPYFVTGAGGERSWTRTTAYAIELGAGLVEPDVSRLSLESCTEWTVMSTKTTEVNAPVWFQDTSDTFGGWPNLSDAIVGARGAWNLYLYTGNSTFLEWAYETTISSLLRAEIYAFKKKAGHYFDQGLFGGAASLMDPDPAYPEKYKGNGELVGKTKPLSTNILYYNGYHYAYKMGSILMENNIIVDSHKDRSNMLKKTIRKRLWMEDKGSYGYFEDEDGNLMQLVEALGVVLAMLSEDFESDHRVRMMFDSLHRTEIGIPSLGSRFGEEENGNTNDQNDAIYQHLNSGRVWPFLSGLFAIAAAKHGYSDIFAEEMVNIIDLSEQGNTFAEFYELNKSFEKERSRQLWSGAGYLGTIYKGLFGMDFQQGGIAFSPNKIEGKDGELKMNETISLLNIKYRNAILDIYVTGSGSNVTSFRLNGEVQKVAEIDGWVTGRQLIEIEVAPFKS